MPVIIDDPNSTVAIQDPDGTNLVIQQVSQPVTLLDPTSIVVVQDPNGQTIQIVEQNNVVVIEALAAMVAVPAPYLKSTGLAGANINAFAAVVQIAGQLFLADPTNHAHAGKLVGVAVQSALVGAPVDYITEGEAAGGAFTTGANYFVGLAGALSVNPVAPGAVWSQKVGIGKDAATVAVMAGATFILS